MSADITPTNSTDVELKDRCLFHVSWANGSSLDGEFIVEFSNDNENWIELDFVQTIDIAGASGYHLILINLITFKYIRGRYERTAGTGTLNSVIKSTSEGA